MSIATEISRLQQAKADIKTSIENKGVTVPSATTLDGYSTLIDSIPSGAPVLLTMGTIRPDAQLVQTYSYDKYINADEGVTIPSYSTSSQTLKASASVGTYTIDYTNYNWYILERCLTIPEYSVSTTGKGRQEYHINSGMYELAVIEPNTIHALIDPTKYYTSRAASMVSIGTFARSVYYSSASAISPYSTTAYGCVQAQVAPTLATGGVITFNSPNLNVRGSTTYFTSTYFNALTDIRYQWVIELYRAPKNNLNLNGWGQTTQAKHIIDCTHSSSGNLT